MAAHADLASAPVVVTGASGFIGRALVRQLRGEGRVVRAVSRHPWDAPAGVRVISLQDYQDTAALAAAFEGAGCVLHLAALAHREGSAAEFDASVHAAQCVVKTARRCGVRRIVFLSSIGVNGHRTEVRPFTEDDVPGPVEPYAHSKLQAEQAVVAGCAGGHLDYVIVRPPLVYGPDAPGNFGRLVRLVRRGWPLPLGGIHNARSFLALDNLLDLLAVCTHHPAAANQVLLAADAEDLSTPELVRHIAAGLALPARLVPVPPGLLRAGARLTGRERLAESLCSSLQVDASKARRLLAWQPRVHAAEGVERAAQSSRAP
ncbi:MAG TPA: NAD-dependent epimerase/dehydratase family protein [Ramlibacter sp.]|uniref:NAD-dependent epimerase/dehydratase family protein n=1 Tax=Ramlibacter sp. TaxID=1917967 RepID=UPI002D802F4F|nr:NAD-dependent epimerase/dehydratase family protein [Ramlibacter sp.]HET8744128.1 NAD-dependent epimerase/dehydratase family protein [Ramlibacter sp.]